MEHNIDTALNIIKARLLDDNKNNECFYLNAAENGFIDLIANKEIISGMSSLEADSFTFKITAPTFDDLALTNLLRNKCNEAKIRKLVPLCTEQDVELLIEHSGKDDAHKVVGKLKDKYTKLYYNIEMSLVKIHGEATRNIATFGKSNAYIGIKFGYCKIADTIFRAPVVFAPVVLSLDDRTLTVRKAANQKFVVNPNLLSTAQYNINRKTTYIENNITGVNMEQSVAEILNRVNLNIEFSPEEKVYEKFSKTEFEKKHVIHDTINASNSQVLGIYSVINQLSYIDYTEICNMQFDENSTFLSMFDPEGKNQSYIPAIPNVDNIRLISPLDMYQQQCISEGLKNSLSIEGNPGSGKSEIIKNIIINYFSLGKRVLVVTEKIDALNVIEGRLKSIEHNVLNLSTITTTHELNDKINKSIKYYNKIRINDNAPYKADELSDFYTKVKKFDDCYKNFVATGYTYNDIVSNELSYQKTDLTDKKKEAQYQEVLSYVYKANDIKTIIDNIYKDIDAYKARYELFNSKKLNGLFLKTAELYTKVNNTELEEIKALVSDYLIEKPKGNIEKFLKGNSDAYSRILKNQNAIKLVNTLEKAGVLDEFNDLLSPSYVKIEFDESILGLTEFVASNQIEKSKLTSDVMHLIYNEFKNVLRKERALDYMLSFSEKLNQVNTDFDKKIEEDSKFIVNANARVKDYLANNAIINDINRGGYTLKSVFDTPKYANLIFGIYNVILITPNLVSSLLPLEEGFFDVVIFDEASQITIDNAIPVMYRAKRAICCGDSKQMAPSTQFQRGHDNESLENLRPLERNLITSKSLLEFAALQYNPIYLQYHHRSKYSRLINFSNKKYYENNLIVADKEGASGKAITYHDVPGILTKGVNEVEAQKVVDILVDFIRTKKPEETIGIITMNKTQQEFVEKLIASRMNSLISQDPDIYKKLRYELEDRNDGEKIFVKNLESVQGDERDKIIISLTFARNENGKLPNFGPLQTFGGEKRLNVCITRAKYTIDVVRSIKSTDINANNYTHDGVKHLVDYLNYMEESDTQVETISNITNPFMREVYDILKSRLNPKYKIEVNKLIGTFKINLAIYNTETERYDLCINLEDNIDFHIPERLFYDNRYLKLRGWNTRYILYINWLTNKNAEINKILEICK